MHERYSRQMRVRGIGESGQRCIEAGRVGVLGLGALGSVSANALARAGVGYLRLIDRDIVDLSNLQRQVLFNEEDAAEARPKAVAAAEHLRGVNSEIAIEAVVQELDAGSIEELIRDLDVVVDGSDNFELRYLVNDVCVKHGRPWVYGGALGSYGMTTTIIPGRTACLQCFIGPMPEPGSIETCSTAGVLAPATGVIANTQAAEVLKLLVGAPPRESVLIFDLWSGHADVVELHRAPDCPVCVHRRFEHLERTEATRVRVMCGEDTVQVNPRRRAKLTLTRVAEQLTEIGRVRVHDGVLRFTYEGLDVTLFSDGRALIRGARDEAHALSLYTEYVGL